jgi:hypothetical protein
MLIADSDTLDFIACLLPENNHWPATARTRMTPAVNPGKIRVLTEPVPGTCITLAERPGASKMVAFSSRVVVPAHVLIRYLDGESVLLNLETEEYFGLDSTGTRMWEISTRAPSIETAYSRLHEEFDVEAALLRTHLTELLAELVDNGLLQVVPVDVENVPAL